MVVNLDDVPRIVHRFGPATLDFLMAAVAERVIPALRDYDVVARIAQGRLGVLLPDTEVAEAEALAATVRAIVDDRPFGLPTAREPVEASVSTAVSPLPVARPADEVVAQAERTAERAPLAAAAEWSLPRTSLPLLEAAVIVAGVIATAVAVLLGPLPDVVLIAAVLVLVGLSEALAFELYDRTSFSISFTPILAAGLLGGPCATLVATWGVAILRGAVRRTRWDKVLFNGAVFTLFGLAADLIASGGGTWAVRANNLPVLAVATLAASAAYYIHTFVIATAVAIDLSADPRRVWERNFRWLFPHYLVLGVMALGLAVATIELGPLGSILFVAPPLMMRFVLKQYTDRTSETVTQLQSTNAELVTTSALLQRRGDELALLSDLGQLAASEASVSNLLTQVAARCVPALGDGCAVVWRSSSGAERALAGSVPATVQQQSAEELLALGSAIGGGQRSDGCAAAPLAGADGELGWLLAWAADGSVDDGRLALMGEVGRRLALVLERDALLEEAANVNALRAVDRAKSDFIATTAHELRTPLTSLQGYTELLRNDVDPALRDRWLRILHVEAAQLGQVVDQLLDVSRLESGRFGAERCAFAIGEVISALLTSFAEQAALSGHTFACSVDADLAPAYADQAQIERVLRNLISNALKYSPNGGRVRVSACETAPGELEVVVADDGMGIPPEWLGRLFERFQRVDVPERASIRGTGLGLYIARQLVERNGGRIWVHSAGVGQGARFHFTLPAAPAELSVSS
jgi:signal transduction histidine kinase